MSINHKKLKKVNKKASKTNVAKKRKEKSKKTFNLTQVNDLGSA